MIYLLIISFVLFFLAFTTVKLRMCSWFSRLMAVTFTLFIVSSAFAGTDNVSQIQKVKVPTGDYVIIMGSIAFAYGVFLVLRARRRKRSRIFLQYGSSQLT